MDVKKHVNKPLFHILPARNEGDSVGNVVAGIKELSPFAQVVVVDDASSDSTILAAELSGAQVLPLTDQLGPWGAMQAGMRYAAGKGCERVVTLDADGQHLPAEVATLIRAMDQTGANVVIGASIARGSGMRRFAWMLMRAFSGITAADLTSGFRLYDRHAIDLLIAEEASYLEHQDIGVLALLLRNDLELAEVGVKMQSRVTGKSRIFSSWFRVFWYMLSTLLLGASKRACKKSNWKNV